MLANLTFFTASKEHSLRQHHSTTTSFRIHRLHHVLEPCKITIGIGRASPNISTVNIAAELFSSPVFERKRRICDYAIKGLQWSTFQIVRGSQSIALCHFEISCTMQEQIHSSNGRCCQILFLTVDFSIGQLVIMHVPNSLNEHTTRTTGWIVNGLSGLGSH